MDRRRFFKWLGGTAVGAVTVSLFPPIKTALGWDEIYLRIWRDAILEIREFVPREYLTAQGWHPIPLSCRREKDWGLFEAIAKHDGISTWEITAVRELSQQELDREHDNILAQLQRDFGELATAKKHLRG